MTRLRSCADEAAAAIELARSQAQLKQLPLIFAYDLDQRSYEAYYPFERDEKGDNKGPGKTPVIDWTELETGIAIRRVRLPGDVPRDDGIVTLEISPGAHHAARGRDGQSEYLTRRSSPSG
jgi:hypothetical protein